MEKRKRWAVFCGVLLALMLCLQANPAAASEKAMNLRVASTWPPGSLLVEKAWKPPLEAIKEKSKGRITYTMFPGATLGKPNEQYDMVRSGKADLICDFSVQYSPGRFPLSELLTIPVPFPKDTPASEISLAVFDRVLFREYTDTKTFLLYMVPNFNYLGKKKVLTLDDMKGLKLRSSGGFVPKSIQLLGATPVHMPPGDLFLSLQTGVVDGAIMGHLAVRMFKLQEAIKYYMLGFSFGSTCNGIAMNKRVWERIPGDLKPMVTEELRKMNFLANVVNDDFFDADMDLMKKAGVEVYSLPPEQVEVWSKAIKPSVDKWVEELEGKGLPAKSVLTVYREECEKRGIKFPY